MSAASSTPFKFLRIAELRESTTNPRRHFDEKKLAELAENIRQHGVLVPLLVRGNVAFVGYEIIAGARRFRAAKLAGVAELPVRVVDMGDQQALEVQVIENLQREDVHPLEEAEGFERLLKMKGYTIALLAEKVGRDESYIYKRRQLAKLIEPLKQAFAEERITISHAVKLAALEAKDQQLAITDFLFDTEEGWDQDSGKRVKIADIVRSPSELDAWIKTEVLLDLARATFEKDDAKLLPKAGACTTCTKRTGANLALFDDTKKGDHCLDRSCFHQKQNAHLVQIEKHAKVSGRKLVRLSREYRKKDTVYGPNAKALKPTEFCDSKEEALHIDGPLVGKTVFICRDAKCKKHADRSGGSSSARAPKPFGELWADRKKKLDAKIDLEVRRELWRQIVADVPEEFNRPEMEIVARRLIECAGHDGRQALCGALVLEGEKRSHSYGGYDYKAPLLGYLERLADKQLPGFLMGLSLVGDLEVNSYGNREYKQLREAAELYEIDAKGIAKNVGEPLRTDFDKKKAKAAEANTKAKREQKRAKNVAAAKKPATKGAK